MSILTSSTEMVQMAEKLAMQEQRLQELEVMLEKVRQSKAHLEIDFQHALEQIELLSAR